jgi:hypothetical protein
MARAADKEITGGCTSINGGDQDTHTNQSFPFLVVLIKFIGALLPIANELNHHGDDGPHPHRRIPDNKNTSKWSGD